MVHQRRPDGGWGWVIVTVSFFTQFLGYGSPLAVGVLYVEWLDVFNEGKGKTAWVGSLAAGVGLIASPLCSASVSSFGARPVAILSGVLVAGGLILSSFAPSLYFLYFSYGFLLGIGCGLLYTATITVTCQYFENRRGLALGIISTGSSVGTFIYAGLQKELIILYGLDGCLLIVGALSLNIIACGILMRPLSELSISLQEKPCLEKVPETYLIYNEKELNIEENLVILEKISNNEKSLTLVTNGDCTQDNMLNKNGFTFPHVTEKDSFLNNNTDASIGKKLAQNYGLRYMTYWRDTVDLFRNKVFSSLFVAILLFDIGGFPPALLLEDVAKSSNIDEELMIVPLVSIIGFTVAIGKLFLGILADFKWINTLYLYVITLLGTGLALFAVPFAKSYISLAILAAILGFFSGNWSIFPYVTTKTVGLDKLTHAYGILMLFAGAGNCLGPPIFGWLFDWTQSYDIAFYFSGICVLSGGCLLLLVALPFWDNRMSKKSKELQEFYSYEAASKA